MALTYHNYDSEIYLYHQDILPEGLAEAIISHILRGWPPPAETTFELLKAERTKVYKMNFHNECYYLKCYRPQNMSKIIKNFFRPADAVRYFQLSHRLQQAGVAVAQPVLALTKKTGLRPADSIL
ncbi:MAG: lipopolysaccharide kinase InaA family protein, partial [Sporomusa sp.]